MLDKHIVIQISLLIIFIMLIYKTSLGDSQYEECMESRKHEITNDMQAGVIVWECKHGKITVNSPPSIELDTKSNSSEKTEDLNNL